MAIGIARARFEKKSQLSFDMTQDTMDMMQIAQKTRNSGVITLGTKTFSVRFHVSDTCGTPVKGAQVYATGVPYNMTTGFDDNNDGAFNDRPLGVTRNSLRGDWTWNLNLNVNKRINLGRLPTAATPARAQANGALFAQQGGGGFGGQGGGGNQGGFGGNRGGGNQGNNGSRYSMELFAQAQNVLNHVYPQGYTGNLSSRFFGVATGVSNARDLNVGIRFNF